ncbi:hypothetical protein M6B22_16935 [Jatrophihabitans cynanchi]|jgi:hypothetical protein|uniref:Uncharacterized protein n=1 Tax=Jatrophihabitans cynanchi TaxID=2944128 RepID=A0ABY7JV61_9ACTN|nr:hypothetical protein [Jatrophihabitans sp. SB3-54]WAX56208.1 hypothetical protein M6B22_16935 [Jatrophihabitans sp. SB3-54]
MIRVSRIRQYLLVFDRELTRLVQVQEFGTDIDTALAEYDRLERENLGSPTIEIVLIGSDSLETVRVTHANYFDDLATMVAASKHLTAP